MNEIDQRRSAEEPVSVFQVANPVRKRRRIITWVATIAVVIGFGICGLVMVSMHNQIHHLNKTVATQSEQIHGLQTQIDTARSSVSAAVACLQNLGLQTAICSSLIK
jgi:cell division protein FtsL